MTIVAFDAPLSYRDWLAFPNEGHQYEVVEGIAVMSPAPNPRHQIAAVRLCSILSIATPEPLLVITAPVDLVLRAEQPAHVRQPDLVVVHPDAVDTRAIRGVPLIAIEILSPSSIERDMVTKRHAYADAGCPHYWLVDPDHPAVVAFDLVDGRYVEAGRAEGATPLAIERPFAVRLVPADLVRGAPA